MMQIRRECSPFCQLSRYQSPLFISTVHISITCPYTPDNQAGEQITQLAPIEGRCLQKPRANNTHHTDIDVIYQYCIPVLGVSMGTRESSLSPCSQNAKIKSCHFCPILRGKQSLSHKLRRPQSPSHFSTITYAKMASSVTSCIPPVLCTMIDH